MREAILPGAIATERQLVPDTRLLADGLRRLACNCARQQHSWQAAQDLYREAIDIYERETRPRQSGAGARSAGLCGCPAASFRWARR